MSDEPEPNPRPVRQRPIVIAFLLAGIGIILLNEAADSLRVYPGNLTVGIQIVIGLACLGLAVLWGAKRI